MHCAAPVKDTACHLARRALQQGCETRTTLPQAARTDRTSRCSRMAEEAKRLAGCAAVDNHVKVFNSLRKLCDKRVVSRSNWETWM